MNSFDFRKRWKYFGESPAIVSLKANTYLAFFDTPQPDIISSKKKQAKVMIISVIKTRTHLKNVFWPNLFVGASFQILDIQQYASGFDPQRLLDQAGSPAQREKLRTAAILNQNPIFEIDSKEMKGGRA